MNERQGRERNAGAALGLADAAIRLADRYIARDGGEPRERLRGQAKRARLANAIAGVRAALKMTRPRPDQRAAAQRSFEEIVDELRALVDLTAYW